MRLLLFRQRNFRNLALEAYRPPPGLSALVGANAQGKTSLLLGIHLALGGRSPWALPTSSASGRRRPGSTPRWKRSLGPTAWSTA
nr:AAA family ATPase [Thermus parvatiensis]